MTAPDCRRPVATGSQTAAYRSENRWHAGGAVGSAWTLFEAKQEALAAWQAQEFERGEAP